MAPGDGEVKLPKKAEAELRNLRRYASYIGCGCNGTEECEGQPNCAQADFKRIYRRFRDALRFYTHAKAKRRT
jgi:hypothetical protein